MQIHVFVVDKECKYYHEFRLQCTSEDTYLSSCFQHCLNTQSYTAGLNIAQDRGYERVL